MHDHSPDFGKTATDYRKYRHGFPEDFFVRLKKRGIGIAGQKVLDLGTGTGTVARGFAVAGCKVIAIDPAEKLIEEAKNIDQESGVSGTTYVMGVAEDTKQPEHFFDVVVAGQCWHWFDAQKAIQEIQRVLKPDGKLIIAHYDWIPSKGSVAELSETLILKHNPAWKMGGGNGFYPQWVTQLVEAGFQNVETYSFDSIAQYSHEAWRGRIRASAGISATLSQEQVARFDEEHAATLRRKFPEESLHVPHRCFTVIANAAAFMESIYERDKNRNNFKKWFRRRCMENIN
ncbi:MAG: methyltransferase [Gammaproteobacteria bacterium]|jgi:ubiquinone/menaquinone biosynthesis C-methylase UbiE|nr:methyltransferase [Gammaproteobacteria bacterium]